MVLNLFHAEPLEAESAALDLVFARWAGHRRTNWRGLFEGYHRLRVLTYSAGVGMILELTDRFKDVEIVFGSERVLSRRFAAMVNLTGFAQYYDLKEALVDNRCLSEALAEHLGNAHAALLPRVADGSLRFRLLRGAPSHEKLYLLEAPCGATRVIAGSANLSTAAFTGDQRETVLVFDDDGEAFAHYAASYERDWAQAAPVEAAQIERARHSGLRLEDAPLVRHVLDRGIVVQEDAAAPREARSGAWSREALTQAEREGRRLAAVELPRDRRGRTLFNADTLKRMLAQVRNQPLQPEAGDRPPRVALDLDVPDMHLEGRNLLTPSNPERAAADANLLVDYYAGFEEHFRGDVLGAIHAYWALMVWLYASPFVSFLRRAAVLNNRIVYLYPHAAVVYGKSGAGKSQFIKTVQLSMYGLFRPVAAAEFTRTMFRGLRTQAGVFPIVVDDIQQRRFTDHAVEVIKDDFYCEAPAPVVILSANQDLKSIDTEIAKRCVVCHLDVSVPPKAAFADNRVRRVQENLGTDLYRSYVLRMLPRVRALRAALNDPASTGTEVDLLHIASRELVDCFSDHLGAAPPWARRLDIGDYVDVSQHKIQQKILDLLRANPGMFDVRRRRNQVILSAGTPQEARSLQRDLHDTIVRQLAADKVVLDLAELENFLGVRIKAGWKSRLWR